MPVLLERFLYGPTPLQMPGYSVSPGLAVQEALLWRGLASLDPLESGDAYGLFSGPSDQTAFVRASRLADGQSAWEYLLVPYQVLVALGGDLSPLRALVDAPLAPIPVEPHVEAIVLPDPVPWPLDDRRAALETFLESRRGEMGDVWSLLGMALHERGLMIHNGPERGIDRVRLVQALMALLPTPGRILLTFTTERAPEVPSNARIAFAGPNVSTGRWTADLSTTESLPIGAQGAPYVQFLQSIWMGGVAALLAEVDAMESIAGRFADGRPLGALLTATSERRMLDRRVVQGEPVDPEVLRQALRQMPPEGDLGPAYYGRLLDHALKARDTDAALLVTRAMDADPSLDSALLPRLELALETEPDAVYAFVRARVASGDSPDPRWLSRLAQAAAAALNVAVSEGDVEIVRNWLRLLAREPLSYGLTPTLANGLETALPLGRTQPDLARTMLVVAAKREPESFGRLMDDAAFVQGLPQAMRDLLCTGDCDTLTTASGYGVELLLAALARAADEKQPALFTPETMDTLWSLAFGSQSIQVAEPFSAQHTVSALVADPTWLHPKAISALLAASLRARQDSIVQRVIQHLAASPDWPERAEPILAGALKAANRPASEYVALLGGLASGRQIGEQTALAVTVGLLNERGWTSANLPLAVQAARGAQHGLPIPAAALDQLLELARSSRDEAIARDTARRIAANLEAETNDEALTEAFARLTGLTRWNAPTSAAVLSWWRGFARSMSAARLARLDKAFEDQPELGEARNVAGSLLALRRMLGKRKLPEFAASVADALALLQSLDEAYEGGALKREGGFDAEVIRMDLVDRMVELPPTEVRLLANQLAALAQLIGELGDSRTKPALLRREDSDQLLAHGETDPHSAVDALKWMSGFLGGAHRHES
ncbi:MAG: hypothetical protein U0452_09545 [Anaerolineae bacterium]